jgi:hypothetical protein
MTRADVSVIKCLLFMIWARQHDGIGHWVLLFIGVLFAVEAFLFSLIDVSKGGLK